MGLIKMQKITAFIICNLKKNNHYFECKESCYKILENFTGNLYKILKGTEKFNNSVQY